jgi:hypothetical protein
VDASKSTFFGGRALELVRFEPRDRAKIEVDYVGVGFCGDLTAGRSHDHFKLRAFLADDHILMYMTLVERLYNSPAYLSSGHRYCWYIYPGYTRTGKIDPTGARHEHRRMQKVGVKFPERYEHSVHGGENSSGGGRWAAKALWPVHWHQHWTLLVVDFEAHVCAHYDSLSGFIGPAYEPFFGAAQEQIRVWMGRPDYQFDGWVFHHKTTTPQQGVGTNDCGVYTCKFAECTALRKGPICGSVLDFRYLSSEQERVKMLKRILAKELL